MKLVSASLIILLFMICAVSAPAADKVACENCGYKNPETNKFCFKCGTNLAPGLASFVKDKPVGKIKEVTPGRLMIDKGAIDGIEEGQRLNLFIGDQAVFDPDTGDTLDVITTISAKLKVVEVHQHVSFATYSLTGVRIPQVNDLVFMAPPEPERMMVGIWCMGGLEVPSMSEMQYLDFEEDDFFEPTPYVSFGADYYLTPKLSIGPDILLGQNADVPDFILNGDNDIKSGSIKYYGVQGKFDLAGSRSVKFRLTFGAGIGKWTIDYTDVPVIYDERNGYFELLVNETITKDTVYAKIGTDISFRLARTLDFYLGWNYAIDTKNEVEVVGSYELVDGTLPTGFDDMVLQALELQPALKLPMVSIHFGFRYNLWR